MRPDFAIINMQKTDGYTVVSIDTTKATHQGIKWKDLGDFGKRKFENLLVLSRANELVKVVYV